MTIPLFTRRFSTEQIFQQVLQINIKALEKLIEDKELLAYKNIFPTFESTIDDAESFAKQILEEYTKALNYNLTEIRSYLEILANLRPRWFNTLRSTLYLMEEEFLVHGSNSSVYELWDIFFQLEEAAQCNLMQPLEIRMLYTKEKN